MALLDIWMWNIFCLLLFIPFIHFLTDGAIRRMCSKSCSRVNVVLTMYPDNFADRWLEHEKCYLKKTEGRSGDKVELWRPFVVFRMYFSRLVENQREKKSFFNWMSFLNRLRRDWSFSIRKTDFEEKEKKHVMCKKKKKSMRQLWRRERKRAQETETWWERTERLQVTV